MISRRHFLSLTAATAGGGMIGAADALAVEPGFSLILKEWTVEHLDWPAAAPSLRIGILTDIHAVEPWMSAHRIGGIVDQLNAQKPDVIVLLGDYVNGLRPRYYTREVPIAEWIAPLQSLHAPTWRLCHSRKSRYLVRPGARHSPGFPKGRDRASREYRPYGELGA